jgi:hypothetical protein
LFLTVRAAISVIPPFIGIVIPMIMMAVTVITLISAIHE